MKRLLIAAVLVLGFASPAAGVFFSGNDLLERCTSRDAGWQGLCLGYVMGIADAMDERVPVDGFRTCRPSGVGMRSSQLRDVVIRHLRNNPQDRHTGASALVARAFAKTWPCKK